MSTLDSAGRTPSSGAEEGTTTVRVAGDRGLQRLGQGLLFTFHAAARALRLYPLENQTVQNALADLIASASQILRTEERISLRYVGDLCFINDLRLRIDLGTYATFGAVGSMLRRHEVGQIDIGPEIGLQEWTTVLSLLSSNPHGDDPFGRLVERLEQGGVRNIELGPMSETKVGTGEIDRAREAAKRTYAQSVSVARDLMTSVRMGKGVSLRRVKRTVQSIVDQVLNNETSIVGMTALRDYDEYTFVHSVNVCIFSVALGKKLGLTKTQLYELGMGALLHDVGKLRMPVEVINKTSQLSETEWALMMEHPTEGFLSLFDMRGFSELPLRAMLMAYEHHMKVDQSGYPVSTRPRRPTLYSRIVAVADGFDAATSKRSYQSDPWPPDQVLQEMRDNAHRGQDPLLVKAFISMTGIYPVGSLVILDTFELAVVIAANPRPNALNRPIVRIIYDEMGLPLDPPQTIDLTESDPSTGQPLRTIIKTTDPERYGIHVSDYLV